MKINLRILTLVSCAVCMLMTVSCSESMKSYEELKRDEKKIVNRLISAKNIEVLKTYPTDGVFGENQFVELKGGIYLNVVDSGNGERAVYNSTTILIRTSGEICYKDTAEAFDTFSNTAYPMEFKYGSASTVRQEHSTSYDVYYMLFGIAMQEVLKYVGDSAVVKMIVPGYSEVDDVYQSTRAGSWLQTSDPNEYLPIYYDRIKYIFYK